MYYTASAIITPVGGFSQPVHRTATYRCDDTRCYIKIKIYRTIILPVVLYGCETWSLTLREERKLGRPRHRWLDNIRMDLQEVGCGYMDWIGLAQDRDRWRTLVSAVMNLRVP